MSLEHTWDDTVAIPGTERAFKLNEPIEIRINRGREGVAPYVLACWVGANGMIGYSLSIGGVGTPHSLANLGSEGVFPHKAVVEWQNEVIDFVVATRYGYTIGEVR